jgi:UDP-sugar pyrophosphorylase
MSCTSGAPGVPAYRAQFPYLFAEWPASSPDVPSTPEQHAMLAQLIRLDRTRSLADYTATARRLLNSAPTLPSAPPAPPAMTALTFASEAFFAMEKLGATQVPSCGFVLVAGGLGERLGQSEIKLALATESTTHTSFLGLVLESLDALGARELCIMTSQDTHARTAALLGRTPHRVNVCLLQQGAVPAIANRRGEMAKKSAFEILEKPHGHGDVHALLHESGTAAAWLLDKKLQHVAFFQDTNPMALRSLVAALGVSAAQGLDANVVAVPRRAKSAAGVLCSLGGRLANVEYNLVDAVLPGLDCNDPASGLSPFPGNTNQLLFRLATYAEVLRTHHRMPEFINPKYKSGGGGQEGEFDKPTRVECLMQDFLLFLPDGARARVTLVLDHPASIVRLAHPLYAPAKNDRGGAKRLRALGAADGGAASSEAAVYAATYQVLRELGVDFAPDHLSALLVDGAEFALPPRVVIAPSVLPVWADARDVFPHPERVRIAKDAVLVLQGPGRVIVEELDLKGSLWVRAAAPACTVRVRRARCHNAGGPWLVPAPDNARGFAVTCDCVKRVIESEEDVVVEDP